MFIYFIQKKGFLDGDLDYLRNRLQTIQERKGKDKFLAFYQYFLLRLFHEGLGKPKPERKKDLESLIGEVPYLNGGLFDVHQLEKANPDIQISDDAFKRLFDFFDAYQWHLDDRPLHADHEINPDVLGYIFEKYINQKQMGAYYTKEDITGYNARNTLIPFLFNAAEKTCAIAFKPDSAMWRLLREDPDRYIYAAMRHGVDRVLPPAVAEGVADVSKRKGWNVPATEEYALPTETWREHVARRQRCVELRAKLSAGEVHDINDLITLNLDICQFAEDVIANCEGSDLLLAFWKAIQNVTVLDPTCGSGAFLQGPHPLACEWVATQLARWFGLPTFDYSLLAIDAEIERPAWSRWTIRTGSRAAATSIKRSLASTVLRTDDCMACSRHSSPEFARRLLRPR